MTTPVTCSQAELDWLLALLRMVPAIKARVMDVALPPKPLAFTIHLDHPAPLPFTVESTTDPGHGRKPKTITTLIHPLPDLASTARLLSPGYAQPTLF